ncbi:MAG: hypothetical protein ACJAYC_003391 [Halieaceae bacterium]|jgi:hypothetical protein
MAKFSLLFAVILLQACTRWQYELGVPLAAYSSPAKAEERPTMAQVMAELGPPLRLSATASGYVMAWEHWRITENSVGFSLGAMGADFLSIDWGQATVDGEFMLLTFDRDRKLSGAALSEWSADLGGGSAVQPFVGVVDVVDVNDLVNALPQHGWGGTSLLPLPEVLNVLSRPEMGDTGIQQRGTPTGIGQQSLEMR